MGRPPGARRLDHQGKSLTTPPPFRGFGPVCAESPLSQSRCQFPLSLRLLWLGEQGAAEPLSCPSRCRAPEPPRSSSARLRALVPEVRLRGGRAGFSPDGSASDGG